MECASKMPEKPLEAHSLIRGKTFDQFFVTVTVMLKEWGSVYTSSSGVKL